MYDKNKNIPDGQENSLQYKEHSEFFVRFFELRTKCTYLISKCRIDKKLTPQLVIALYDLVTWSNSQLIKVTSMEEIYELLENAEKNLKEKKNDLAFKKLSILFDKISQAHSEAELLPKVWVKEKDEVLSSLDDKTRYALEAWKLVYSQE